MTKSKSIKAIVLAAGKGTRMKSSIPKVLHKIFSKTLLERVLDSVLKLPAIEETFIIVGHQSEEVSSFVKNTYTNEKIKTILQMPQLGTGDAVNKASDYLKGYEGTVIITCGDTPLLKTETLQKMIDYHNETTSTLTVMSAMFDNPTNYGRIVRSENNEVLKIVEEKDANSTQKQIKEVNAGVYCLNWGEIAPAFSEITANNAQGEYYLTDIIDWAVKNKLKTQAYILENNNEMFGINSKQHLAEAAAIMNKDKINELLTSGVTIIDPNSTYISPETTIGADTIIYPGCFIDGNNKLGENNIIGPNSHIKGNVSTSKNVKIVQSSVSDTSISNDCTVGPFAHLRNNVEINNNVRIGNFVEIKNSSIEKNTNVSHLSYIGDAELGKEVNVGAGSITANYNPLTKAKNKTIIADEVKIGSNSVLVAPIKINKGANIGAGSIITKEVPEYSLAVTRSPFSIIEGWVKRKLKKNN